MDLSEIQKVWRLGIAGINIYMYASGNFKRIVPFAKVSHAKGLARLPFGKAVLGSFGAI